MLGVSNVITHVGRWELDHDPVLTASCFAQHIVKNPCDCTDCRNFRVAIDSAFPPPFRHLLNQLGIDVSKPAELCHYGQPGHTCPTGGWFHFIGSIVAGGDAWRQTSDTSWTGDLEPYLGMVELGFSNRVALLPTVFIGHPIVQLEFSTNVPWVLEDSVLY